MKIEPKHIDPGLQDRVFEMQKLINDLKDHDVLTPDSWADIVNKLSALEDKVRQTEEDAEAVYENSIAGV